MKICLICKNEIEPDSRASKYCSDICRRRVKYERDRKWFKANPDKARAYGRKFYYENHEAVLKDSRDRYRRKQIEAINQMLCSG